MRHPPTIAIRRTNDTTSARKGGCKVVTVTGASGNPTSQVDIYSAAKVVKTTSAPPVFGRWKRRGNARKTAISTPTVTTYSINGVIVEKREIAPLRAPVRARWKFCSETTCHSGSGGGWAALAIGTLLGLSACTAEPTDEAKALTYHCVVSATGERFVFAGSTVRDMTEGFDGQRYTVTDTTGGVRVLGTNDGVSCVGRRS